jgi:two-component system, NarL family, nitrate/nitrite response regulator NarL
MESLTVLIVASDPLTKAGLASILHSQSIGVIDDNADGAEHHADVVVWDGEIADELTTTLPILALVPEDTDASAYSNAQGILYRSSSPERIIAALHALAQGLTVFEPAFVMRQPSLSEDIPTDLTPRELEVLRHLAEGLSNKAIAKVLGISENTVKFHVNALLEKFGVGSRTEVVIRAIQHGLVTI